MGVSENENAEQILKMNPVAAENGGFILNGSTKHAGGIGFLKLGHFPYGLYNSEKKKLNVMMASLVLNVVLFVAITAISIAFYGRSGVLPPTLHSPSTPTECCPGGWIGYQRKCYYFSESEGNWTYSQNYCASFNASLVVIDSQEEMSFLSQYKGPANYWIGLQRMSDQEPWRWIDGTIFNNWFEIWGREEYAYLNHRGVASSSIRSEEPWICSKPVHK